MGCGKIEVNTSLINTNNDQNRADLQRIRGEIKSMYDEIAALDTMWSGTANEAFNRVFREDYESFIELCDNIEFFLSSVTEAKELYDSCDNTVGGLVSSIRV